MATTHLFAVGRILGGAVDILLAPARQQPVCSDDDGCRCYAYSHGYDDAKAGDLPEPLHHVSALCCIEKYMMGYRDACTVKDAQQMTLPAGELQRLIDEAEDTEDYEWDIDDRNIWRRGGW